VDGFLDGQPILVKVLWSGAEVALLNGKPTTYGLLGEIQHPTTPGALVRYFVPWSAISYLKQDIPAPAPATDPVVVPAGGRQGNGGGGGAG
jgi:hypothetical protein